MTTITDDTDWAIESIQPEDAAILEEFHDGSEDFAQRIIRRDAKGLTLPWQKVGNLVRFEPGRFSVWSGATFSGKTQLLRQLALHAAKSGEPCLFVSLEEEAKTVRREFAFIAAHTRKPDVHFVDVFGRWLKQRIYVANTMELLTPETLLRLVAYAVVKLGVRHVFVDSLMRLAMRKDDYDAQRRFGNLLSRIVRMRQFHFHLVVHPSKAGEWGQPINPYNIAGAQELVAQADTIATMHRPHEPGAHEPTNVLRFWKQRGDTDWVGEIELHYHQQSRQFLANQGDAPMQFMEWPQYPAGEVQQPRVVYSAHG